jgi:hypothetical protein
MPLSPSAALPGDAVESGFTGSVSAQNASPVMVLRTQPPVANGEITTQGRVTFNLCNSNDPDQNPDAPEQGDTLNWQFHFGDSGAPAFNADGSFNPDFEHFCRAEHTYAKGQYTATVTVTDKHLEDQSGQVSGDVSALARVTRTITIVSLGKPEEETALPCKDGVCTVFTSSTASDGNLGGLSGADAQCQSLAAAASLGGTFLAWLSDATASPATRFTQNNVRYVLPDGITTVADSYADLTDGTLDNAISQDENGATRVVAVWTGTQAFGVRFTAIDGVNGFTPNGQCTGDWSVGASAGQGGIWGFSGDIGASWSEFNVAACGQLRALYCFEQ